MGFGGIFGILLIVVIVWAVMQFTNKSNQSDGANGQIAIGKENALDIIKRRYARGEIDRQEFERMRKDLMQS